MNPRRLLLPGPILVRVVLWVAVFLACPLSGTAARLSFELEVLGCTTFHALPPGSTEHLVRAEGVLAYLEKAELKESDPWLRDDVRIAWIATLYASRGNSQPFVDATYRVLGCHPDQVWSRIEARRHAQLGVDYEKFFGEASSPKKPVRSVRPKQFPRRSNAA
jgi:hypothetical protein